MVIINIAVIVPQWPRTCSKFLITFMEKINVLISFVNILRLHCCRFKIAVFQSSIFMIFFQFCNLLCDVFKTHCSEIEACFRTLQVYHHLAFHFLKFWESYFSQMWIAAPKLYTTQHSKLKISTLPYISHKMQENKMTFVT